MAELNEDIIRRIMHFMDYESLKNFAVGSRQQQRLYNEYIHTVATRARTLGVVFADDDEDLVEGLYHLNGYLNDNLEGIRTEHDPTYHRIVWEGPGGKITRAGDSTLWTVDGGTFHRVYGPAYIKRAPNGQKIMEMWYLNGRQHRRGGPAQIERRQDGTVTVEAWFDHGLSHRKGGPAQISHSPGQVTELWFDHGLLHRRGGPAQIVRREDGTVIFEKWFDHGLLSNGRS